MKTSFIHAFSILLVVLATTSVSLQSWAEETALPVDSKAVVDTRTWFLVNGNGNGRDGTLFVTANVREGYHIYAMSQPKPFIATEIQVTPSGQATVTGDFEGSVKADVRVHDALGVELHEQEGQITWTAPLILSPGVAPQSVKLTGQLRVQACTENRCLSPSTILWEADYGEPADSTTMAAGKSRVDNVASVPDPRSTAGTPAAPATFDLSRLDTAGNRRPSTPSWIILPIALLAGFILNFMPCVLPVMGLKLMSFLQQAGDSRRRAFALNVSYKLGILSVMMVLASLAVFAGIGWGEQFSSSTFSESRKWTGYGTPFLGYEICPEKRVASPNETIEPAAWLKCPINPRESEAPPNGCRCEPRWVRPVLARAWPKLLRCAPPLATMCVRNPG